MLTDYSCRLFTHKQSWSFYPPSRYLGPIDYVEVSLLQLVAVFPRPPLTHVAEFFVLVHLLGDPISKINNLLLKLASCQARAPFWKDRFESREMGLMRRLTGPSSVPLPLLDSTPASGSPALLPPSDPPLPSCEGIWKGLAALADFYDE
jgi:hypothetical protein